VKKLVILFLVLGAIVLIGTSLSAEENRNGFRGLEWGILLEQVYQHEDKNETTELVEQKENKLIYLGTEFDHEVKISYQFDDSYGLFQGTYELVEKNLSQTSLYLDRFREIEKALVASYGNYHDKQMHWRVELYKDEPEEWGRAVAMRHLNMGQAWFFQDLLIGHFLLEGDRFLEVNHRIVFVDPNFEDAEDGVDL